MSVYVCVYIYDGLYPLIVRPAPPSTLPILLHLGFGEFLSIEIKKRKKRNRKDKDKEVTVESEMIEIYANEKIHNNNL